MKKHGVIIFSLISLLILILITAFLGLKSIILKKADVICSGCNVVLLSIDSLRADHMSLYGYHRLTTPVIDNWARNALIFDNYFSTAFLTPISEGSVHTGLHPDANGITKFTTTFSHDIKTLAELFKNNGYQTIAFGNSPEFFRYRSLNESFSRGFDKYLLQQKRERIVNWYGLQEALKTRTTEPLFLWITLGGVHSPFGYKLKNYFVDDSYSGPMRYLVHNSNNHAYYQGLIYNPFLPKFAFMFRKEGAPAEGLGNHYGDDDKLKLFTNWPIRTTNADLQFVIDSYDNGIVQVDKEFANLLSLLKENKLDKNTIIILQSEHGESIGEHDYIAHYDIWDEISHVPLIISSPVLSSGSRHSILLSAVDVFPTILNHVGIPLPNYVLDGIDVIDSIKSRSAQNNRKHIFLTRTPLWESVLKVKDQETIFDTFRQLDNEMNFKDYAIRTKTAKLIHRRARFAEEIFSCWTYVSEKAVVREEYEFYDLVSDPQELSPLPPTTVEALELQKLLLEFEEQMKRRARHTQSYKELHEYQ